MTKNIRDQLRELGAVIDLEQGPIGIDDIQARTSGPVLADRPNRPINVIDKSTEGLMKTMQKPEQTTSTSRSPMRVGIAAALLLIVGVAAFFVTRSDDPSPVAPADDQGLVVPTKEPEGAAPADDPEPETQAFNSDSL